MQSGSDYRSDGTLSTLVRAVTIDSIRENRNQPRTHFDEQALDELTASIREHGLIQPLLVTEYAPGQYELIAGERRWRAARRAGFSHVPVLVKDATPQQLLEIALVENVQRADLNPLEEGRAYQTLKDEFGLKDDEIAQRVGKSRVAIANARRLIKLIPQAQQALIDGTISAGHGRALLRLEQPEQQLALLKLTQHADLSVRACERIADLCQNEALVPAVCRTLLEGTIRIEHVQSLLSIVNHSDQRAVLEAIVGYGLDVRDTEHLCALVARGVPLRNALGQMHTIDQPANQPVNQFINQPVDQFINQPVNHPVLCETPVIQPPPTHPAAARLGMDTARQINPDDAEIQRLFEEVLGTPVQLVRSGSAIKLIITLYSDEQLQSLYDLVAG